MDFDYDVVIVGGAFSGAATAQLIKRKQPNARVLIIEKNAEFDALAKRRLATGHFGRHNSGWRELYDGFVPDFRVTKLLRKGLFRWWKAELTNFRLMFASPIAESPRKHPRYRRPRRRDRTQTALVARFCRSRNLLATVC